MKLIAAHPRQSAGWGANFSREVRKRSDIITIQRHGVGELATGDLHPVAGISGEADYCLLDLFPPAFTQRSINKCRHKLPDPVFGELLGDFPRKERGSVNKMTRCKEQNGCRLRPPRAGMARIPYRLGHGGE